MRTGRRSRRDSSHASAIRKAASASRPSHGFSPWPTTIRKKASNSAS